MNDVDCRGCEALTELEAEFREYRRLTDNRLAEKDTQFAVINTKLSAILWLIGVVGTALVGVLIKILFG